MRSFDPLATNPGLEIGPILVKVGATGLVRGGKIALSTSEEGTIVNHGRIIGDVMAIQCDTDNGNVTLTNKGTITGRNGPDATVNVVGEGVFTLNNGGLITNTNAGTGAYEMQQFGFGTAKMTNWGTMDGNIILGPGGDEFTNFKKVGNKVISGTLTGLIDLREGGDIFRGGSKKEIVIGGGGDDGDFVELGGGNDQFWIFHDDGQDHAGGGGGIDTLVIKSTPSTPPDVLYLINIHDTEINQGLDPRRVLELPDIFDPTQNVLDEVISFENVIGGPGREDLYGSAVNNVINGGGGDDNLHGLGAKDTLEGGGGIDTFWFHALSESRVAANKRDLILDFATGEDEINLGDIDANATLPNDQPFHLTANGGQGAFTRDPGELGIQKPKGLTIVSGDVNGDGKADFSIALNGHVALVDTDFAL